ncbi:hypothetical protein HX057_15675 [Myroides odoratimimus]|uniref:Uncharacterized protein n=1 Tax=Myroides odoratimimus TaxID=76832 RepID=A0AAI8G4F6_9FLAO|nr:MULTISPECIES: hypothetical protein [Myroides]SHM27001.1 hypothetical protein SAMN05444275_1119 [Myroides odoratimimus subsp. xuanwuensis]ALU26192.1 hypothetical protein AS202_08540 [Myroides odoratimimus]APA92241.1 hypothetical protein BK054_08405 [Myroides sp. ZB35]EPH09448.1 hypothetical protein HMPREF9713_02783 [Myroides odoratimimus CCUG 12700]MCO7722562.1 hypothetical protein [Myroides odoratimimus]
MTKKLLNQLALLTILNNIVFVVIYQGSLIADFAQSPQYIHLVELAWILCLTGLIIFPTIICTLLESKQISVQKFPILAIALSFISIIFFAFASIP